MFVSIDSCERGALNANDSVDGFDGRLLTVTVLRLCGTTEIVDVFTVRME